MRTSRARCAFARLAGCFGAETWGCATGQKMISQARSVRGRNRQSSAQGEFFCGQPVQNLCLPWAQYMGVAEIETQAAFQPKNMVRAAADISISY